MGKASKKTEIVLELTEKEAEVLVAVLAAVNWDSGEGCVASEIYDSLCEVGVRDSVDSGYQVTYERDVDGVVVRHSGDDE